MNHYKCDTQQEMPRYRCYKEVHALKIKEVHAEQMPIFKGVSCKGSYVLGTACGNCERCTWEKERGPCLGGVLVPEDVRYGPIKVGCGYMRKHEPTPGGYYVVYADNYESFSPVQAFEEGYSRV